MIGSETCTDSNPKTRFVGLLKQYLIHNRCYQSIRTSLQFTSQNHGLRGVKMYSNCQ